jgi:HAD superfamily hydrolase (TIGR01509 family)
MDQGTRELAAVAFDLDGVLLDSEPVWESIRRGLVAERGGRWLPVAQNAMMGMSTAEWSRYLSSDLGVGLDPEQVAAIVIDRMAATYADGLPLIAGADAAVRRIAARWPLALASSSPRRIIDVVLARTSWDKLFRARVSTEETGRGKPAPDVYQTAAARLGVLPSACAAVEDSTNGLRSAAAAGMLVVAVPRPRYPPDPAALAQASLVLDSLHQLTVARLEQAAAHPGSPSPR